jgi:FKBP-type peptidyl-prolyl cis-trans isomerase
MSIKLLCFISAILILAIAGAVYYFGFGQKGGPEEGTEENAGEELQLKIEILKEGTGKSIEKGETAVVHYVGTLEDGTKFDSSIDRGQSFSFTLGEGRVIAGWEQGVLGMKVGEKRKLTIASDLAYGDTGIPGVIPGGATLIFEVELLEIK